MQVLGDNVIFEIIEKFEEKNTKWIKARIYSAPVTTSEISDGDIVYIVDDGYDYLPNDLYITSLYQVLVRID